MSMSKEALEYLVNEGFEKNPIVELSNGTYSVVSLERVCDPVANSLVVSTLTGLVDYIKTNTDTLSGKLLIQVESPTQVNLFSPLNADRTREGYITAQAVLPDNIYFGRYLDTERFNIMLQSSFVSNDDREIILKYTGLVQDEAVKTYGDDGVSQQVTVKTGVASVGNAVVPNPVTLAPYRTFPEIEQPESKFIFRMQNKQGPEAALYEADGKAWRNKAIRDIKEYLEKALEDLKGDLQIQIIA